MEDDPGNPAENSTKMIGTLVDGFRYIGERTDSQHVYFGKVFSLILFIEHKINQILIYYEPSIKEKMLGEKISIYKKFIKELERIEPDHHVDFGFDFTKYEKSKQALAEVNMIRRQYAHAVKFSYIKRESIRNICDFNRTERIDLWENVQNTDTEDLYIIAQLHLFCFCFSHATTELINAQKRP